MNLTLLEVKAVTSLFFFMAILMLAVPALAQAPQPTPTPGPCVDQSPRNLNMHLDRTGPPEQGFDYNFVSGAETVTPIDEYHVKYQRIPLELCDRHYHVPVENVQGCPGEKPPASAAAEKKSGEEKSASAEKESPAAEKKAGAPPVGSWVEVHKVYAARVDRTSPECSEGYDHDLKCCAQPPFVVLGYVARIEDKDITPPGVNLAEWTGSATSEPPTGCNATPAKWRFTLGCDRRLTQATLEHDVGGHAHSARAVQGPNLVSTDLTFVGPAFETAVCRDVRTEPIADNAAAQRICPGVCKWPLNRFKGTWTNKPGGFAVCGCCPLQRPQQ